MAIRELSSVVVELGDDAFEPFDPRRDAFRDRLRFDRERLTDLLQLVDEHLPGKALELGAAPYILTAALLFGGWELIANGLPISGYSRDGRLTIRYTDGVERSGHLRLFDVEEPFPLASEAFDAVVAGEIFEHLYRQPWMLISECWRCLRPGGRLYLTTPNGHSVDWLLRWVKRESTGMGFNPEAPSVRHAREYGPEEIREVLVSQGFAVERLFTRNYSHIGEGGFPGLLGPLKRAVYRSLHRLSERERGPLHQRGGIILAVATRTERPPADPPDFMLYGIGDERTGYNFRVSEPADPQISAGGLAWTG